MMIIQSEKDKMEWMSNLIRDCKVFIDTCSIMYFAIDKFWDNCVPILEEYNQKIIIPYRCIEELSKLSNHKDVDTVKKAKFGLKQIRSLAKDGFVEIRGEQSDDFADSVFFHVFSKFRMQYKLLLITQDRNLAKDILALNNTSSVRAKQVYVKKIDKCDFLKNVLHIERDKEEKETGDTIFEKFNYVDQIASYDDTEALVTYVPKDNDEVYTERKTYKLGKEIGRGGEGIVYYIDSNYVAKIYYANKNTLQKKKKIELMLSKSIKYDGICYPVDRLFDREKRFVGILMPKAEGVELQRGIFRRRSVFEKRFPTWKKRDTVELCITILKMIEYLHSRNIIIGDINQANIMVVSPQKVYFVDTDSYQIEGFPCPVGTINFTPPERQGENYSEYLRTIGNENFAVATLLFMIMLPGKVPYSQQGGDDQKNNIRDMNFSYPLGELSNKKTPDGPWKFMWSHLTYKVKEAFYHTFQKNGKYSAEKTRLSAKKWRKIFEEYLTLLDSGQYGEQDKMSEEIFPTRLKKSKDKEYEKCILCGVEYDKNWLIEGICTDCINNKGEGYACRKCGRPLLYSNYRKMIEKKKPNAYCVECKGKANRTVWCKVCGRSFVLTNGEVDYFEQRKLDLPKRCAKCRNRKVF